MEIGFKCIQQLTHFSKEEIATVWDHTAPEIYAYEKIKMINCNKLLWNPEQ